MGRRKYTWRKLNDPSFEELGVRPETVASLAEKGITHPLPHPTTEPAACPRRPRRDRPGQDRDRGTLAFGIPLLERLEPGGDRAAGTGHRPGRELCMRVAEDIAEAGKNAGARVLAIYGGKAYEPQIEQLKKGVDVVVGTPGRLIDLNNQKILNLSQVKSLVLDEADEMLDMGFPYPTSRSSCPKVPPPGRPCCSQRPCQADPEPGPPLHDAAPTHIRATDPGDDTATVEAIEQHVWRAHSMDKPDLISKILQADGRGRTMIFCKTKRAAQKLTDELIDRGFKAGAVHGDLGQGRAREGAAAVPGRLDRCARGHRCRGARDRRRERHPRHQLHVPGRREDVPAPHRPDRAGPAPDGVAVTLVDWDDLHRWKLIDKALGLPFADPIETYSTSEHVFTGLGSPRGPAAPQARRAREDRPERRAFRSDGGRKPAPVRQDPRREGSTQVEDRKNHRLRRHLRQRPGEVATAGRRTRKESVVARSPDLGRRREDRPSVVPGPPEDGRCTEVSPTASLTGWHLRRRRRTSVSPRSNR